jgi:exonuclease VII small subunit
MDFGTVRLTIRRKLENGRLPLEKAARVWGRSAAGEACDGCEMTIGTGQLTMDALARKPGRKAMQLHLRCFEIWTEERSSLLRERERSAARPLFLGEQPA